jgi:hypothetical protein
MVGTREVDREAWADVIRELMKTETRGKKEPLARLLEVNARTITHWLDKTTKVSEASIRQVAEKTGRSSIELLVHVGYYSPDEVAVVDRGDPDPDDEAMRLIIDSDFPPRVKMRMIQRLEELRARDRVREAEEVRWWIEQTAGATGT